LVGGDPLAVLDAGAYTLAQASHYNGRPLPAVVLITASGEPKIIRRRDSYQDLLYAEV
jgi:diaminopimelate decarboxylase